LRPLSTGRDAMLTVYPARTHHDGGRGPERPSGRPCAARVKLDCATMFRRTAMPAAG